ncbi:unnamed protein product [Rhizophagus irregularis]|nr:unnamed protein product [Rhizophagus irregularis]
MGYCKTPELTIVSEAIKNIEHLTLVGTVHLEMELFTNCHNIKYWNYMTKTWIQILAGFLTLLMHHQSLDLFTKVLHACQELIYLGITGPSIFRYQNYLLEFGSDLPPKLEFLYYDTIPKYCEESVLCEFFSNIVKNLGKAISIEWNPFNQEYHNRIIKEYADSGNVILKKLNEESVFSYVGFEQFITERVTRKIQFTSNEIR